MLFFEGAYLGLKSSGYAKGIPLWGNILFYTAWFFALVNVARWNWNFTYKRCKGGLIPDLIATAFSAPLLPLLHGYQSSHDYRIFLIVFLSYVLIYVASAQYYYKKIKLGIDRWGTRD